MLINTLTTETGNQVVLVDQVLSEDRLNQLHAMCAEFSSGCKHWPQPDWCNPLGNVGGIDIPRYMFDNKGNEWAELVQYFSGDEFRQPFEQHLNIKLEHSASSMWADMTGFGALGPHKEAGGGYMMQVYLTDTPHDYSGTTIYNEAGQVLVQRPDRDNFCWFFHGGNVMHGRHHDVHEGITRFTLQIWYTLQNKNKL